MSTVAKAQKYDEILRLWNEHHNGEIRNLLAVSTLFIDIQDVIDDDIENWGTEVKR